MGGLRFEVSDSSQIDPMCWSTAYITGIEGIPWACRRKMDGRILSVDRDIDESGRLNIVWPTSQFGNLLLCTTSLRPSPKPYILPLELARGTVHRVRSQAFDWQRMGMRLSESYLQVIAGALERFIEATISQGDLKKCQELSQQAIDQALSAGDQLAQSYSEQALQYRHQSEKQLTSLLGVRLPMVPATSLPSQAILDAGNTVTIPLEWALVEPDSGRQRYELFDTQVQWARQNGLRVCAGPLISLQPHAMPAWLYLLENDFEALLKAATEYAANVVQRYKGKVHLWHCAAGLNAPSELKLNDEQVLRLAVSVIQTVRRMDDRAAVVISVDQPWSEYLSFDPNGVSPIHFADALIRADLGLSGLGLELNMNYWPGGSLPRDLLELSRLLDRWTLLGLPLLALVTQPTSMESDPIANGRYRVVSTWGQNEDQDPSKIRFQEKIRPVVEMLLAKQAVQGIIWAAPSDEGAHPFAASGLWDLHGRAKPLLADFASLKKQHLGS